MERESYEREDKDKRRVFESPERSSTSSTLSPNPNTSSHSVLEDHRLVCRPAEDPFCVVVCGVNVGPDKIFHLVDDKYLRVNKELIKEYTLDLKRSGEPQLSSSPIKTIPEPLLDPTDTGVASPSQLSSTPPSPPSIPISLEPSLTTNPTDDAIASLLTDLDNPRFRLVYDMVYGKNVLQMYRYSCQPILDAVSMRGLNGAIIIHGLTQPFKKQVAIGELAVGSDPRQLGLIPKSIYRSLGLKQKGTTGSSPLKVSLSMVELTAEGTINDILAHGPVRRPSISLALDLPRRDSAYTQDSTTQVDLTDVGSALGHVSRLSETMSAKPRSHFIVTLSFNADTGTPSHTTRTLASPVRPHDSLSVPGSPGQSESPRHGLGSHLGSELHSVHNRSYSVGTTISPRIASPLSRQRGSVSSPDQTETDHRTRLKIVVLADTASDRETDALSEVIQAINHGYRVPYQKSTLSRLLKDCIGKRHRAVLVSCVSSELKDAPLTFSSLKYAANATAPSSTVQDSDDSDHSDSDPEPEQNDGKSQLQLENERLKMELEVERQLSMKRLRDYQQVLQRLKAAERSGGGGGGGQTTKGGGGEDPEFNSNVEKLMEKVRDLEKWISGMRMELEVFKSRNKELEQTSTVQKSGSSWKIDVASDAKVLQTPTTDAIDINITKITVKDGKNFNQPRITVSVVGANGLVVGQQMDTPIVSKADANGIYFNTTVRVGAPSGYQNGGYTLFFEFKHFKKKMNKVSTRCFGYITLNAMDLLGLKDKDKDKSGEPEEGKKKSFTLHLYKKPTDFTRKKTKKDDWYSFNRGCSN